MDEIGELKNKKLSQTRQGVADPNRFREQQDHRNEINILRYGPRVVVFVEMTRAKITVRT